MARKYLSPLNLLNLTSDPGTATEGDFYWNSSTNRLRIYFDGAWGDVSSNTAFTNATNTFTAAQTITPATSVTGLTINGAASSRGLIVKANATTPGNLQEWQDSSGNVLSRINSSGNAVFNQLNAISTSTSTVLTVIRAATSQTADLTQWQNSAGTALRYITSSGQQYINSSLLSSFDMYTESGSNNTLIAIPNDIWADKLRFRTGTYEYSADGSTSWTGGTFQREIIDGRNDTGISLATTNKGHRWVWNSADIAWSTPKFVRLTFSYTSPVTTYDVTVEASSDGTTWASKYSATGVSAGISKRLLALSGWAGESYVRVTLVNNANTNAIPLRNIEFLSYRPGDQGGAVNGIEENLPLTWNSDKTVVFQPIVATGTPIIAKGFTSQSADLTQWQDSSGNILGGVNNLGYGYFGPSYIGGHFSITPASATNRLFVLRGAASQSADLTQWQNSSGTSLAKVDASGNLTAASFVKTSGTSSQFLKADGSVDSSTYLTTGTASSTYAPLASPTFTGTPLSTTAAVDTNTTQIATTAYVIGQGYLKSATASSTYAPLASPAFTGSPSWVNSKIYGMNRTMPTVVDNIVELGSSTLTNGGGSFEISIVVPSSGFSVAKQYLISVNYDETANTWKIVNPISDGGPYSSNDFALEINVSLSVASFRIRRTLGTTAGTAYVSMKVNGNTPTFTETTGTASVTAPTTYYNGAVITQKDGAATVNGNLTATQLIKSGGTSLQYLMADGSTTTSSTTTSMNYSQTLGTRQTAISTSGVTIVSTNITTGGNPVQIIVTGDAENSSAGGWIKLKLYRGTTAIGNTIHVESSAASENIPYALTVVDTPAAGTYTYSLKTESAAATGNFNFGETDGPVITAMELNTLLPTTNLNLTGTLTADQVLSTNNGNGTNFKVGDDAWLGDINTANTVGLKGVQSATSGYLKFGGDTNTFGYNGTSLVYGTTVIPPAKTLLVSTDIGSSVQAYDADLAAIAALASGTGLLKNTAGTWSLDTSSYLTTGTASSTYLPLTGGTISSNLTITGDLVVNGTTTNLNSTNLVIEDKNIILGDVATPSNTTADGGGITLKGATDKTFNWVNATGYWTSNVGVEASSFIKTSGTSSQFLKADGSVDSSTYLTTGTASSTYAPLASPTFTGTPLSTTAAVDTNTTQIATTAYVIGQGYLKSATASSTYAPLASPSLTGTPLSTTAAADTNTTQIATTAYVIGQASSSNPVALGTVAVGTSLKYARADHVHPTTGLGLTSGTLAQFAATTSSQLAGVISDETGSGALVFGTGPTVTLPVINNYKTGYTTTATAAGTTTLTSASNKIQLFTGTTTQTVVLPVTSTLATGMQYEIHNNSTGIVTVQSSGLNTVIAITPGASYVLTCIGTTLTTAADWDYEFVGTGTITGTGSVVLSTSPTLTTPSIGVATATSINKMAITAPATSSTLAVADGKTFTVSNTITLSGTDSSTLNIGSGGTLGTGAFATIANYAPLAGATFTGQIQSTLANSTTTGGGQIYLNGATGNRVDFNQNGTAAPAFTTRSVGTKIVLYPNIGAANVDYAIGIDNATLWNSVTDSTASFKWYAGTTQVASLSGAGLFTAVSKSFDIQHPTKPDMRLRYGSLEGPENGVYVRGNTKENIIELPEYWTGLVDESTITVSLTSVGKFQKVYLEKIEGNKVYIGGRVKEISYVIFGERKDIDKITVEY